MNIDDNDMGKNILLINSNQEYEKMKGIESNLSNYFKSQKDEMKQSYTTEKKIIKQPNIIEDKKRAVSRPKTAYKKTAENMFRDNKVDSDIYYKVREENDGLKRHQLQLNDDIKKLNTALEKVKYNVLMERKLSDRKVINTDGGFDVEVETLKIENQKKDEKIKKMAVIIKGLQSHVESKSFAGRKNLINAKSTLESQNEKNEYLKMINYLRELLKTSENEVKRLSSELNNISNRPQTNNLNEFNKELRDKNSQLAEMESKYEKLKLQYETNVKILELSQQKMQEYIGDYTEERKKNMDLEKRIQLMEANLAKMTEYVNLIEEYKKKEKHLEDRIKDLCENPFIKQAEERGNVYRKLQESELSLNDTLRRLKQFEENNKTLEKENKILKEQYQLAYVDRDRFKEEAMRFKISNEEKEKHAKNFEEQFKLLGQYGEVDSNFSKILNILKLRDDNTSWMKMDFLEKINDLDAKDPTFLIKEVERIKIEKGMLGSELEKTKSLLQIQQQINEDQLKLFNEEKKILKAQNDILMKRCEELAKLIDMERLPKEKEYLLHRSNAVISAGELKRELGFEDFSRAKYLNKMPDEITEFSKDENETEYGINENALDLYIGEALLEEGLERELGFKLANMMSFLTVDFYLHDTQTSNLLSGSKPIYNFQVSFKVKEDEHLIYYLESDYILIDIYYIKDNMQALLGRGKISLKQIIELENVQNNLYNSNQSEKKRASNGICQIFYSKDENLLIGSIHYKMRMRQPMSEIIKWYKDRNQLIREISPVHDVMLKKVEKELISVNNYSKGKIMSITILLTKAVNLKIGGAPRKMNPYIYYQFYKFDEHFTDVGNGCDPLFQDVSKYEVVYDNSFHDYIENDCIEFYILDNSRPLEVELKEDSEKTKAVNLVENQEYDDLIGTCKVHLKDLLIHDLIQNSFPIINRKGQISGNLVLNIFWEQISIEEENSNKQKLPYETKMWEDTLIIKLANLLKNKALNLDSAFNLFDKDNKQAISIVDFKEIILFTLKFTSNQNELEDLTKSIFNNRNLLSKLDFYKIFAMHLPHEGPMEDLLKKSEGKAIDNKTLNYQNKVIEIDNFSINIGGGMKQQIISEKNNSENILKKDNTTENKTTSSLDPTYKLSGQINQTQPISQSLAQINQNSNRSLKEIVGKLNDYMMKTGKSSPSELYKMFDRDGDLKVGKDVNNSFIIHSL
jgi:hypothetical protein